jgi:hypothetical protein
LKLARLSIDHGVRLWTAIDRYTVSCGGEPDKHIYGNTPRMSAVAEVEAVVAEAMASGDTSSPWLPIAECAELEEGEYLVAYAKGRGSPAHRRVVYWTGSEWWAGKESRVPLSAPQFIHRMGAIPGPARGGKDGG